MRTAFYVVLGVALGVVSIYLWHRHMHRNALSIEEVVVEVDTLIYRDVEPLCVTPATEADSLPIYHFADSVDGVWSADIAGHDVELRSLVLRDSYESRRTTIYAPPTWEVTAKGGFSGVSSWVGVGVEHNVGRMKISFGAGYDPFVGSPHVEGSVGVVLWRK